MDLHIPIAAICESFYFCFFSISYQSTRVKVNFGDRTFCHLEGHAHREAADLLEEVESSEAVAMLFAELPFNNEEEESEEDRDKDKAAGADLERDEGVVIELSQTGPPTRRLKIPMPTIGESLHSNVVGDSNGRSCIDN